MLGMAKNSSRTASRDACAAVTKVEPWPRIPPSRNPRRSHRSRRRKPLRHNRQARRFRRRTSPSHNSRPQWTRFRLHLLVDGVPICCSALTEAASHQVYARHPACERDAGSCPWMGSGSELGGHGWSSGEDRHPSTCGVPPVGCGGGLRVTFGSPRRHPRTCGRDVSSRPALRRLTLCVPVREIRAR